MDTRSIIEITNVSKIFRVKSQDVPVLKKINLEIKEKEFVIIFGPSGCGKSTLLHIMLGLEPPTTGSVHLFSFNYYQYDEDHRSEFRKNNIGMVYQQPNWIKSLTVIENVIFALTLLGTKYEVAKEKAFQVLKLVGMENWANYLPTELSSGQQQKVSLARALITNPKIIIADEPTGNLDYQSGLELMKLFQKLHKEGKTIIMVTHNIDNIEYASSVVQMFDGEILKVFDTTKVALSLLKTTLTQKSSNKVFGNEVSRKTFTFPRSDFTKKSFTLKERFRLSKQSFKIFLINLKDIFRFIGLLLIFIIQKAYSRIYKLKFIPSSLLIKIDPYLIRAFAYLFEKLEKNKEKTIKQVDLINLAIKNMLSKKTRTIITIGGMAIGIGAIVFLVSIGYGLEKMVILRVARLDEMKQIDASPAVASNIKINDKTISQLKDIQSITKILPIIGVVGKINYNNSATDVAVYGVLSDYLKESAIKPIHGKIFSSNELNLKVSSIKPPRLNETGEVAGTSTEVIKAKYLEKIDTINFKINEGEYVRVRKEPKTTSALIGYTRRVEGISEGEEYWGGKYITDDNKGEAGITEDGEKMGLWLKAKVPLWEYIKEVNKYEPMLNKEGHQIFEEGYFAQVNMLVEKDNIGGSVLGITEEIASLEAEAKQEQIKKVTLPTVEKREIVVNKSLLKVLSINENSAVNKKFNISFIVTGELGGSDNKIESNAVEYSIIGVISEGRTPIAYVPLVDLKQLGLTNYSQVKLVTLSQKDLPKARRQVEVLGLKTASVVDTVSQIEGFFATLRLILGLLGVVALSVAALGMFNTLTISLLERTHEVGMMKAIGMKSQEVWDLFLTESMIMGLVGGIGGLFLGFTVGKILSIILSVFAIFKGAGFLDITFIPFTFVFLIVVLSVSVGILTGIYPAHRATKISALNALRYE